MHLSEYDRSKAEFNRIMRYLTPTEEEQTFLILQGKCPHNKGWTYAGHGHNDDAYECYLCSETKWY